MLDPKIRNEYVIQAWAAATLQADGTRTGCIWGPRGSGSAMYVFTEDSGVWVLAGTEAL